MTGACVAFITAKNEEEAVALSKALVSEGLAACVNVVPYIRSIFRWKGAIEDTSEVLMVAKTIDERFEALKTRVVQLHSYEVPEVIRLEITAGHSPYLEWLKLNSVAP
jgi:periplasmic divalent cation tolerance protein